VLKLSSEEQLCQALIALVTKGSSELKLVSDEQSFHDAYASFNEGSSALKLVSDEQLFHAELALVAVGSGVLNEVSPLDCHALVKFTLLASVPSFAPAGNDVRAEVLCHADVKVEQLLKSSAGKDVRGFAYQQ